MLVTYQHGYVTIILVYSLIYLTMLVSISLQLRQSGCKEPGWFNFIAFTRSISVLPIVLDLKQWMI